MKAWPHGDVTRLSTYSLSPAVPDLRHTCPGKPGYLPGTAASGSPARRLASARRSQGSVWRRPGVLPHQTFRRCSGENDS